MASLTYLFISPHLDDAALSCGGLIYRLVKAQCRVVVATVVTADAPSDLVFSRLIKRNHAEWGLSETPFAIRCSEDIQAVEELGAEYIHLGFLDAIYRTDARKQLLYKITVFTRPAPFDLENYAPVLSASLQSLLNHYGGKNLCIFCPLTIGGHVDHIIVRRTVELICMGMPIVYYEDFPYASKRGVMSRWMKTNTRSDKLIPFVIPLTEQETNARIASIAQYSSQLGSLFLPLLERMPEIVRSYLLSQSMRQDEKAGRARAEFSVRSYLAKVGGERYWLAENAKDTADLIHLAAPVHAHELAA